MVFELLTTLPASGCLVTDDIVFEPQDDVPPTFVFRPRSDPPMGETLIVDTDRLESEGTTNLTFFLQVRDENLQQDLETQIRLRTLASPNFNELMIKDAEAGPSVPGNGRDAVRGLEFSFLTTELRNGHCHQLQLAVSGAFFTSDEDRFFAVPLVDGDVAIATWWLWETSADAPVNPETCPTDDF